MPSANAGNDMPDTASVMPTRSGQRLRQTADRMPMTRPKATDHAMLATVSQNVGMKRSPISVATGRLVRSERPKSQWKTPWTKRENCSGSERSSPRSLRTRSTVSGLASGPAASRAGSPGRRCTNRKISRPTDEQRRQQAEEALGDVLEHRRNRPSVAANDRRPRGGGDPVSFAKDAGFPRPRE